MRRRFHFFTITLSALTATACLGGGYAASGDGDIPPAQLARTETTPTSRPTTTTTTVRPATTTSVPPTSAATSTTAAPATTAPPPTAAVTTTTAAEDGSGTGSAGTTDDSVVEDQPTATSEPPPPSEPEPTTTTTAAASVPPPTTAAPAPPPPSTSPGAEGEFFANVNAVRAGAGKGALAYDGGLTAYAQAWASYMAGANSLVHSDLGNVPGAWTLAGENVGVGPSVASIHNALVASPGHYANIVGDYSHLGVGVAVDSQGRIWVAQVFAYYP